MIYSSRGQLAVLRQLKRLSGTIQVLWKFERKPVIDRSTSSGRIVLPVLPCTMSRVSGSIALVCLVLTVAHAAQSPQPSPAERLLGRPYLPPAPGPAAAGGRLQSVPYDASAKTKVLPSYAVRCITA